MADPFEEEGGFGEDEPGGDNPGKKSDRQSAKREREKQRRSNLAKAFEELGQLLAQIDPEDADSQQNRRRRRRSGGDEYENTGDAAGMTRLDTISRTIDTLRHLHSENINLRRTVEKLRRGGGDEKVRYHHDMYF